MTVSPIAVSVGDVAGVGPFVSLRAALELCDVERFVLFGDAAQLLQLAHAQGADRKVRKIDASSASQLALGEVGIIDTGRVDPRVIERHTALPEVGEHQWHTLDTAAKAVQSGELRALVTGPTSKAAIVAAGHPFTGQTEFLAGLSGLADDDVTMMFLGPRLNVALVTTHLSIADAPRAIQKGRVMRTVRHLADALQRIDRSESTLRVVVAGLNPHAGEGGLFGSEEAHEIEPALLLLSQEAPFAGGRVRLSGPAPAEAVFRAAQRGDVQGVVAMLHDQATIASKLLDWGSAVNVTWGLPFVRTSVDHGVAYDAARAGTAEHEGMLAAMQMARRLTERSDG